MNAFKQALVGTYSDSDTVIELNSISDTVGAPDYLVSGVPLILYDSLFGNPADSNNAGDYEIVLVTDINYATNEITVTRAQENTTAQTISAGWSAVYGLTQAGLDEKLNRSAFEDETAKSDFEDADSFLRWDSVSGALRRFTWANLKTAIIDFLGIEVGVWTPVLNFGGNTTGITYSTQSGTYVKIWEFVFAPCLVVLTNKGSSTGAARMTGIPFNSKTGADLVPITTLLTNVTFSGFISTRINSETELRFANITEAGGLTDLTNTNFSNNTAIRLALIYRAA